MDLFAGLLRSVPGNIQVTGVLFHLNAGHGLVEVVIDLCRLALITVGADRRQQQFGYIAQAVQVLEIIMVVINAAQIFPFAVFFLSIQIILYYVAIIRDIPGDVYKRQVSYALSIVRPVGASGTIASPEV